MHSCLLDRIKFYFNTGKLGLNKESKYGLSMMDWTDSPRKSGDWGKECYPIFFLRVFSSKIVMFLSLYLLWCFLQCTMNFLHGIISHCTHSSYCVFIFLKKAGPAKESKFKPLLFFSWLRFPLIHSRKAVDDDPRICSLLSQLEDCDTELDSWLEIAPAMPVVDICKVN